MCVCVCVCIRSDVFVPTEFVGGSSLVGVREWSSLVGVREWFSCFCNKVKKKKIQISLKCSSVSLKVLKYFTPKAAD
jgi:hypothetical protein